MVRRAAAVEMVCMKFHAQLYASEKTSLGTRGGHSAAKPSTAASHFYAFPLILYIFFCKRSLSGTWYKQVPANILHLHYILHF